MRKFIALIGFIIAGTAASLPAQNATSHASLFSELRWRNIGPLRAARTRAVAGMEHYALAVS